MIKTRYSIIGASILFAPFFVCAQVFLIEKNHPIFVNSEELRQEIFPSEHQQTIFLEKLKVGENYLLTIPDDAGGNDCPIEISPIDSVVSFKKDTCSQSWHFTATAPKMEFQFNYCPKNGLPEKHWVSVANQGKPKTPSKLAKLLAGLEVQSGFSATELVQDHLLNGPCLNVTGIIGYGNADQMGTFSQGMTNIGINDGIILATGSIDVATGPNDSGGAGTIAAGSTPDPDLAALAGGGGVFDRSMIEFTFTPNVPQLQFQFVFASEEYCEFVGTAFNDRFGFFISGPGISGPFSNGSVNLAVVPATTAYVGINSINHQTNTVFFKNNAAASPNNCDPAPPNPVSANEVQYDGFTAVMTAVTPVLQLCSTYYIKLKVGDIGDPVLDSAVFLKGNSFGTGIKPDVTTEVFGVLGASLMTEGCSNGGFVFTLNEASTSNYTITYTLSGTATNSVDYSPITNSVVIPAGSTEFHLPVNSLLDGLTEPIETIILTLNESCSCQGKVCTLLIKDPVLMTTDIPAATVCNGSSVTLTPDVVGGTSPYSFLWSNGDTTFTTTVSPSVNTTYSFTVTDDCGQISIKTVTVTVNQPPGAQISGSLMACSPGPVPFSIPLAYNGPLPFTLTYSVDGSPTTVTVNSVPFNLTGLAASEVSLLSISSGPCPGTVSGTFTIMDASVQITATPTDPSCNSSANGSILLSSNGAPNINYAWTPANLGNTNNPQNLAPGTYSVTLTDANNCTATASATLNAPPPIALNIGNVLTASCGSPTGGGATATASGGVPGFDYLWSDGSSGPVLSGVGPGNFSVTATDASGCTKVQTVAVPGDFTPPIAIANAPNVISCTNSSVEINGNGSSTGSNFTYQWTANPGNIASGDQSLNPIVDQAGTYFILVANTVNGCSAIASVAVTSSQDLPTAVANAPIAVTCSMPTLTISGAGSSTGPNFSFLWTANPGNITSGSTSLAPTINQAGTYTLVVTNNSNSCSASVSVEIEEDNSPPIALISTPEILNCINNSIEIDASASDFATPSTFSWSPAAGILSGGNTLNPIVNAPGNYTLTITQSNGCTDVASVLVSQNTTLPIANATVLETISCTTSSVNLLGEGSSVGSNFTYEWTTANGNISCDPTVLLSCADEPGTYNLLVTNTLNGCTAVDQVAVTGGLDVPNAEASASGDITCAVTLVSLSGAGSSVGPNFSYQWTTVGGSFVSGQNTLVPFVNSGGTYTILVTNTANGCTNSAEVEVLENKNLPVAVIFPAIEIDCNNAAIELDATGSTISGTGSFQWTAQPPGNIVSGATKLTPFIDEPGIYTLKITDTDNGCTDIASVSVTADFAEPIAAAGPDQLLTCPQPTSFLGGNSSAGFPFTYFWQTTDGHFVSVKNTPTVEVDASGTYILTVLNTENGCSAEDIVIVTSNIIAPIVEAGPGFTVDCNISTINLNGAGTATGTNFTYEWTTLDGNILSGAASLTPSVNAAGTYFLKITNNINGCTAIDQTVVLDNQVPPVAAASGGQAITCTNPTAILSGAGSSIGPNFSYLWTTTDGNITAGATSLQPTVNEAGTYVLVIKNVTNGCTSDAQVIVNQDNSVPIANAAPPGTFDCATNFLTINASGSSQGAGFSFVWSTVGGNFTQGQNTLMPTVNEPGVYVLTITNLLSQCTATATVLIEENTAPPPADAGLPAVLNCNISSVEIGFLTPPSDPDLTFQWTTSDGNFVSGQNGTNPVVDVAGTYNLLVINTLNKCSSTAAVVVAENIQPPIAAAEPGGELSCTNNSIVLDGSGSSNGANFLIEWTTQTGQFISGQTTLSPTVDEPGTYFLKITDLQNGCTATSSTTVTESANLPTAIATAPGILTCSKKELTLSGFGSTTGQGIDYQWVTSGGGNILSGASTLFPVVNEPGEYILIVKNTANGCTETASVFVNEDLAPPLADAGSAAVIDCLSPQIVLNGSGSAAGSDFIYFWKTTNGNIVSGETGLSPIVDLPGQYQLIVTNLLNGCTALAEVTVTQSADVPTATAATPATLTCAVVETVLNGSGSSAGPGFSYNWTTVDGLLLADENTLLPTVGAPGTYILLVTNQTNACTSFAQAVVVENTVPPVAEAGQTMVLTCQYTSISLNATGVDPAGGPLNFLWSGPNIISGANLPNPLIGQPGWYKVLITSQLNGCSAADSVQILADVNLPIAAIAAPERLTCLIKEISLDATNGTTLGPNITYQWLTADGNFISKNNLLAVVDAPGNYQLLVTNLATGCSTTASVLVDENIAPPVANAGPTQVISCTDPNLILDGNGSDFGQNFTVNWTAGGGGNIVSGENTLSPTVDQPGIYTLEVVNNLTGCKASDEAVVEPDLAFPIVVIAPPGSLNCIEKTLVLDATGSSVGPDFSLNWTTVSGNFTQNQNSITPIIDQPGVYNLLISNVLNGCTNSKSVSVTQNIDPPMVDAGPGFELNCSAENGSLNATAMPAQVSVFWETTSGNFISGNAGFSPKVDAPGMYKITVTRPDNGCTATDETTVTKETNVPTGLEIDLTLPRCDGDAGEIVFTKILGGIGPFLYSIDGGGQFFTENGFKNINPGNYSLLIVDANSCEWAQPLNVPAPQLPTAGLDAEINIELGDSLLMAVNIGNYPINLIDSVDWKPTTGLVFDSKNIVDQLRPTAKPLENTRYSVTIFTEDGCTAVAKTLIRVDNDYHIFIPNVISPTNSDGQNDIFLIFGDPAQVVEITAFEVFDRWGDKVWANYGFKPNDPVEGWNAVMRNDQLNPGVFVYWARVKFIDGRTVIYKGDVTVVR